MTTIAVLPATTTPPGRTSDVTSRFDVSPRLGWTYEGESATLRASWHPAGVPSFTLELLEDLQRGSRAIEARFGPRGLPLHYIVLKSSVPGIFNVGGDLGTMHRLIAAKDRDALTRYTRTAIDVVYRNHVAHALPGATTIALVEGDALGGGFECALSCDVVVMERHARAGFPEVLFDMFPGMGGISFLHRRVNRRTADEIVRTGRQYSAQELHDLGVIDAVVPTGEGEAYVRALVRQRSHHAGAHAAMTRVDRIVRPVTREELDSVGELWVERALALSGRGLAWMQRLHERQLGVFARGAAMPMPEASAFPCAA